MLWCAGAQEQDYIRQEARTLFRQNQSLQDPGEIEAKARASPICCASSYVQLAQAALQELQHQVHCGCSCMLTCVFLITESLALLVQSLHVLPNSNTA
jgi:hypothetical protein